MDAVDGVVGRTEILACDLQLGDWVLNLLMTRAYRIRRMVPTGECVAVYGRDPDRPKDVFNLTRNWVWVESPRVPLEEVSHLV